MAITWEGPDCNRKNELHIFLIYSGHSMDGEERERGKRERLTSHCRQHRNRWRVEGKLTWKVCPGGDDDDNGGGGGGGGDEDGEI